MRWMDERDRVKFLFSKAQAESAYLNSVHSWWYIHACVYNVRTYG